MSEAAADFSPVVHDGFSVSSSEETSEQIRQNFESEPKPLDGEPADPEKEEAERVSKAASELGKKGAAALALKKAEAAKETAKVEPDEEEDGEPGEKAKPGSGSDLRLRMKEATREAAEVKRQLATERQERERLAEEIKRLSKPAERAQEARQTVQTPGKPKLEDFADHSEWVEAVADFKAEQKLAAYKQETEQTSARQRQEMQIQVSEAEKETRIKKTFADAIKAEPGLYDTLTAGLPPEFFQTRSVYGALKTGEPVTAKNYVAEGLLRSNYQVEMAKYFANNRQEYDRISALGNPDAVNWEMAQVEGMLKHLHNSPPEAAITGSGFRGGASKAKPPVKPVTGSPSTANSQEGSDDEPVEAHFRRENARDRSRARGELR